jgi:hypothetical protein
MVLKDQEIQTVPEVLVIQQDPKILELHLLLVIHWLLMVLGVRMHHLVRSVLKDQEVLGIHFVPVVQALPDYLEHLVVPVEIRVVQARLKAQEDRRVLEIRMVQWVR